MDQQLFLTRLRDLSPEEGRAFLVAHVSEIADHAVFGVLLKDEALNQCYIQPAISLKLAELLIFFGEHVQHRTSYALGLAAKGDAFSALGHEQVAMDYFDAAAAEFEQVQDRVSWARTRIGWIISCAWIGRTEEALQAAARAREVLEQHRESYWLCALNHNTAVIYSQTGQYQKAIELYESMLQIYPTVREASAGYIERAVAMAKLNQGRNLFWLGDFERARILLMEALQGLQALGQVRNVIRTEMSLAEIAYAQGRYGSALRTFYAVRDTSVQQGLDTALVSLRIANCLIKVNRADEAVTLTATALSFVEPLAVTLDKGETILEHANALSAARRLRDAIKSLSEAEHIFTRGGFVRHAAITRLRQIELLVEMGELEAAYTQAREARDLFETYGLMTGAVSAGLLIVETISKQARGGILPEGEWEAKLAEASQLCQHIVEVASTHHLQEQVYRALYLIGMLALLHEDTGRAEQFFGEAIEQIERMLADLALDLRPEFIHTIWEVYEECIALHLKLGRAEQAFAYLERARSVALRQYLAREVMPERVQSKPDLHTLQLKNATLMRLQNQLREWQETYHAYSVQLDSFDPDVSAELDRTVIEQELKRCENKVTELFERLHLQQFEAESTLDLRDEVRRPEAYGVDIGEIQAGLAVGQVLLAYFLEQGRLVIFVITSESIRVHTQAEGVMQLERLLPPLFAHLEPRGWSDPLHPPLAMMRRVLQKLYQILLAPVMAEITAPCSSLIIVPYGPLHSLPFHALHDGKQYLVERFQISYLPATSMLTRLGKRAPVGEIQPPLFMGYSGDGSLPRAIEEARMLAEMMGGTCLLEEWATIEALQQSAGSRTLIHLATHGKLRLDAPNFSFVRLADGQLNAIDAFQLELEQCQLVTLSGCETGLAIAGGGDEQIGLGRAFLAAGASSLLMSLWPVEDSATNELMLLFYRELLSGQNKAQALRKAQCALLERTATHFAHPYFWAAFRLVGDTGPLL